jgi:fructosamine-3-kinase
MLPDSLTNAVVSALREIGDTSPIGAVEQAAGGYTNQAMRLITDQASYLLKWDARSRPGMFPTEARGLDLLRHVGGMRVPEVLTVADPIGEAPGFILEEWVDVQPADLYWQSGPRYGERIARLHRTSTATSVPGYGLDHDNYVGNTPQSNAWNIDWVCFFRDQRLGPLVEMAAQMDLLPADRRHRLERLMERLPEWLGGVERRPVLLHGDLWRGNVLFDASGEPVLIDPAVCWGDREFDLASAAIYEPAPNGFYDAYHEIWPIAAGFFERRDLHNLYLLLCCLTGDGDDFGAQIDAVLQRYVG